MTEKRLLLVDDQPDLTTMYSLFLRDEGYEIEVANSGEEALEVYALAKFEKCPYDLIVCDLAMPFLNGFEVEEKIRATGDTTTKVAFLSADNTALEGERAQERIASQRVVRLLKKGIAKEDFCAAVRSALGSR